ncbi:Stk1 family PASTA domain-containing Ser/Thr kinase [Ruminococcus sp. CLA-AA-H200]|uniref:non-specific serine/threonine protein kinase n=1 Tax=Ruminococcus turbiniformis TaxID=2881258 RepID=A0ABS8G0I5_9FIRM|nr:Stk1 family PASTA domain-containing Ser/Thr kinase [Ruminococcus turbiniformis]MCC2255737.1 Stk1 family PASTA domain-containing Ser/Thr kinase [Ruminococcus turbiniformis]
MIKEGVYLGKRYEILGRIGSGGMADVYKGKDHKLNRYVAIKVLKSDYRQDEVFIKKFLSEAQAAAGLMHPNVVNVYDVGQDRGLYYMVMELVEGITLKDYIEKKGRISAKETISISIQMVTGLQAAHNHHIIHRDIKPQNIIISKDGKVKVTDFGIARATTSTQTISTSVMGSVHYTSPEQARGGVVDEKSDIYSIGITMYEMITGHVPFDGDSTVSVALKHLQEQITSPSEEVPDLPYSLECIIMKCTQKNPALRYHDCASLLTDLKRSLVDPDGDFVLAGGAAVGTDTDRTVVMSTEELEQVQRRNYNRDDEEDDYDSDDDEDEEDDDDDYSRRRQQHDRRRRKNNVNSDTKRIMKILMIVAGVVIALLVLFLVANAAGFFSGGPGLAQEEEETVEVPDLRGMTEDEARAELKDMELGMKVQNERQPSSKYAEGEIMSQDPQPGENAEKHTTITVVISSGEEPEMTTVPNVVNSSEADAEEAIRNANLVVSHGEAQYSDEIAEGNVISSDPTAGTEVEEGTTVTIVVSLGEEPATVPDLRNKSASQAESDLAAAGLVGSASEEYSDTVEAGIVISQGTEAGSKVAKGSTVNYVVSLGPETEYVSVPSLSNCTEEEARQKLEDAGLTVGTVDSQYSTVQRGYVITQTASPGSSVEKGTAIGFTISLGPDPASSSGGQGGSEDNSSGGSQ